MLLIKCTLLFKARACLVARLLIPFYSAGLSSSHEEQEHGSSKAWYRPLDFDMGELTRSTRAPHLSYYGVYSTFCIPFVSHLMGGVF